MKPLKQTLREEIEAIIDGLYGGYGGEIIYSKNIAPDVSHFDTKEQRDLLVNDLLSLIKQVTDEVIGEANYPEFFDNNDKARCRVYTDNMRKTLNDILEGRRGV